MNDWNLSGNGFTLCDSITHRFIVVIILTAHCSSALSISDEFESRRARSMNSFFKTGYISRFITSSKRITTHEVRQQRTPSASQYLEAIDTERESRITIVNAACYQFRSVRMMRNRQAAAIMITAPPVIQAMSANRTTIGGEISKLFRERNGFVNQWMIFDNYNICSFFEIREYCF